MGLFVLYASNSYPGRYLTLEPIATNEILTLNKEVLGNLLLKSKFPSTIIIY